MGAALAIRGGDAETAIHILRQNCFPTYGTLRKELLALWWTAQKLNATAHKNKNNNDDDIEEVLTTSELLALRKRLRCDGDSSTRRIDDPCICGPPNLGYQYS